MPKKTDLLEKIRALQEQSDEAVMRLENGVREEFMAYIRNLRRNAKVSMAKEALHEEINNTATEVISSLLASETENNTDTTNS